MDTDTKEIIVELGKETIKEIGKDVYFDGLKPIVRESGETFSLIPATVNAIFADLKIWTLKRKYSVEEMKIELEKRLEKKRREDIISPDYSVFIPALESLSYSMEKEELREMYYNLLENTMDKNSSELVHPSFGGIINQMTSYEARLFRTLATEQIRPYLEVDLKRGENKGSVLLIKYIYDFVDKGESEINLEKLLGALSNLERLGLIDVDPNSSYTFKDHYNKLNECEIIKRIISTHGMENLVIKKGFINITEIGKSFSLICLKSNVK